MRKKPKPENWFEPFADLDTDGAVFQVGLQHYAIGTPGPAIHISTGALDLQFNAHITDLDALIEGLKAARKALLKRQTPGETQSQHSNGGR